MASRDRGVARVTRAGRDRRFSRFTRFPYEGPRVAWLGPSKNNCASKCLDARDLYYTVDVPVGTRHHGLRLVVAIK